MTLDEEAIKREIDPLGWARDKIAELDKLMVGQQDLGIAYKPEYLEASAIYFNLQPDEYARHLRKLKARGIRIGDFERKVRETAAALKAAEKGKAAAGSATAKSGRPLQGHALDVPDAEPWDQPVVLGDLLDVIVSLYNRFVALPLFADIALALWVLHTYAIDAADCAPRAALVSPEMRCGKTTTAGVTQRLVRRGIPASNISPAAIYRVIDVASPVLILDEIDRFIGHGKNATPGSQEIIGILNSGHTRDEAFVIRCAGDDQEPRKFSTFASIMTASIRKLPDTWSDRSIIIPLQRKPRREVWGRKAKALPIFLEIRRKCTRWVADNLDKLKAADPPVPPELDDRAGQQNWSPLYAIADLASPAWGLKARDASLHLSGATVREQHESWGIRLLGDLRDLFDELQRDQLGSKEICVALSAREERPWGEWGATRKPITPIPLKNLLKPYGIYPKTVSLPDGTKPNGYHLNDCLEAFASYLGAARNSPFSEKPPENDFRTSETPQPYAANGFGHLYESPTDSRADFRKSPVHLTRSARTDFESFEMPKPGDFGKREEKNTPPDADEEAEIDRLADLDAPPRCRKCGLTAETDAANCFHCGAIYGEGNSQ